MRRRRTYYPPAKTAKGAATRGDSPRGDAGRTVSIDTAAMLGRSDIVLGMRVEIASGLYEGEIATVASLAGGVIPAVVVRTAEGRTRRVRAVDLVPYDGRADARQPETS